MMEILASPPFPGGGCGGEDGDDGWKGEDGMKFLWGGCGCSPARIARAQADARATALSELPCTTSVDLAPKGCIMSSDGGGGVDD